MESKLNWFSIKEEKQQHMILLYYDFKSFLQVII